MEKEGHEMAPGDAASEPSGRALTLVHWILDRAIAGVPPLTSATDLAAEYGADRSYSTTRERVKALIRWEATKNFASGFATALGGILTLPVAVPAAMGASWVLQARLAGAIAVLHGHSLKEDRVRTLVLLAVVGDTAKDAVKGAGIVVGKRLTANAISAVPGRVLIQINKLVGLRLLAKAGPTAAVNLAKAIPIAGGFVGGSFDAAGCVAVGKVADRLFAPEGAAAAGARARRADPAPLRGREGLPGQRGLDMEGTAEQKAAATRKRRAAGKKAAATRTRRAAGKKAAVTRKRRSAARKAVLTLRGRAAGQRRADERGSSGPAVPAPTRTAENGDVVGDRLR